MCVIFALCGKILLGLVIHMDYWTQLLLRKTFFDNCGFGFSCNGYVLAWKVGYI